MIDCVIDLQSNGGIVTTYVTHLRARHASGELYIACAETDPWAPREMVEALQQEVRAGRLDAEDEIYSAPTMASHSRRVRPTIARRPSGTGSVCSLCSPAIWGEVAFG